MVTSFTFLVFNSTFSPSVWLVFWGTFKASAYFWELTEFLEITGISGESPIFHVISATIYVHSWVVIEFTFAKRWSVRMRFEVFLALSAIVLIFSVRTSFFGFLLVGSTSPKVSRCFTSLLIHSTTISLMSAADISSSLVGIENSKGRFRPTSRKLPRVEHKTVHRIISFDSHSPQKPPTKRG